MNKLIPLVKTYTSTSDLEIRVYSAGLLVGGLKKLSYQTTREIVDLPVFDRVEISYPKRYVSGSLLTGNFLDPSVDVFDIVLTAYNDSEEKYILKIKEVEFLEKGFAPDKIESNKEYQFIASKVEPWTKEN